MACGCSSSSGSKRCGADPLTGWNGSGDTNTQVRITFKSKEDAIAFCEKKGLQYHLVPAAPVKMKIQAYADNFR